MGTITSFGEGNTVLSTSKSPLKHQDIPHTSDREGCFAFLIVDRVTSMYAKKQSAEQWTF